MSTNGHKSSSEIEHDLEQTRARVSETLDELRAKMSPGQIVDEVLGYSKDTGGAKMLQNLGRTVQENPAPLLLIGAGIAWMMMGGGQLFSRHGFYPRGYDTGVRREGNGSEAFRTGASEWSRDGSSDWGVGSASESVRSAGRSVGEGVSSMASSAANMAAGLRDTVTGAAAGVRDTVAGAASGVRDTASSMQDTASRSVYGLRDSASRMGNSAVRRGWDVTGSLTNMAREQPLLIGAIGLAIGAALGAALPETETEDRLMGEASDAVKRQASDLAAQGYDKAKGVAVGTYEKVAEEAEKQGLTTDKAADLLGEIGDRAGAVLQTAKDTAKQEAERQGLTGDTGGERSLEAQRAELGSSEGQRKASSTGQGLTGDASSQRPTGGTERQREASSGQKESASPADAKIETVRQHPA